MGVFQVFQIVTYGTKSQKASQIIICQLQIIIYPVAFVLIMLNIFLGTLNLCQNSRTKVDKKNFQTFITTITLPVKRLIQILLNYKQPFNCSFSRN